MTDTGVSDLAAQRGFRAASELLSRWAFALLTTFSVLPIWLVARPPFQDFPQHAATVRVLLDHADPALRLTDAVGIDFGRTQYLGFYLVAVVLAKAIGPLAANKLLLSLSVLGTPYALRSLLRALGRDERHALFALPLAYNAHVLLGFLNFVAAIPLSIASIALAVGYQKRGGVVRGVGLALLMLGLFYVHVVPFALAAIGIALISISRDHRRTSLHLLPLVPSLAGALYWARHSPAGESTSGAVLGALRGESSGLTRFDPFAKTLREIPEWLTDQLPGQVDLLLLVAWVVLFVCAAAFARDRAHEGARGDWSWLRVGALAPVAAVASFILPYQHDWIWPIAGRFPHLALLLSPVLLPRMRPVAGNLVSALLSCVAAAHIIVNANAFLAYGRQEVRGFDELLAQIPEGARVVGLIYDNKSRHVGQHPFMHYVAYSQAQHGGVVQFSFADSRQSPFYYTAPGGPPPVRLGFGWAPQASSVPQLASYFEYAMARGQHSHLRQLARYYDQVYHQNGWTLWRRRMGVEK